MSWLREEHRYFDKDFKYEAVRLINEGNRSVKDIAGDLGIHPNLLHQWRRKYRADMEQAFPGKGHLRVPEDPDGHFKIPHPWPGQNPPP